MSFKYKNKDKEIEFKISYSIILLISALVSKSLILEKLLMNV